MHIVCAIRDIKTDTFGPPMTVPHAAIALRAFKDACNGKGNDRTLADHPEDFELYQLAHYDDSCGEFCPDKKQIAVGDNMKGL